MKWCTLQECFEQAGSKFPFTIIYKTHNPELGNIKITFESKDGDCWYPKNHTKSSTLEKNYNYDTVIHIGYANHCDYNYYAIKIKKFKKQLKGILD